MKLVLGDVGLVAAREVRERVRGRFFQIGTVIILLVVTAAIVIPVLHKPSTHPVRVGVVGAASERVQGVEGVLLTTAASLSTAVSVSTEATQANAERDLRAGQLDLVVVDGQRVLVNKPIGDSDTSKTAQLVRAVSRILGIDQAYRAAGLSSSQVGVLANAGPLPVDSLQPAPKKGTVRTTSFVALVLVFVMLSQYNTWTLTGVIEEKASRVVEVLLAAIRPVQLLAGKVLGIGLVAFGQAAIVVAFALGLAGAVGSDVIHGTAPVVLVSTLAWLVLGYAFYCWVYAAAGSMAERQEQVQTLAFPLTLPLIISYVASLSAAGRGHANVFLQVLAYLPPTAPIAMPVLVGLGVATWWQFAASAAISIASTVAVARLAASIYRRAILRTGRRVRLNELIAVRTPTMRLRRSAWGKR